MDTPRMSPMDESSTPDGRRPAGESPADLSTVFNYPSLGRLFDVADPRPLEEMRERLKRTTQDLERVVRQGPQEDAARAARAARAVAVTLEFLGELDGLRREGGGS